MTHKIARLICSAMAALVLLLALTSVASAASGTVTGAAFSRNKNGNYCPTTNACTGSRYVQADYDQWKPISNALVNVYDMSWNYLGQGVTDDNGQFSAPWNTGANPKPAQVIVKVFAWQKESRFYFTDTAGSGYGGFVVVTLAAGANTNIFNQYWGSSASPDSFFNAYWAAELQWRRVMNLVGRLQTQFTGVEVRGFADNQAGFLGNCATSCASGSQKRVQLSADAPQKPQMRIMHELGHIADYVTKPWQVAVDGTWGGDAAGGWAANTGEWGHMSFNEGLATHYGSIAFWWDNAATPTTCLSASHCYTTFAPLGNPLANTNIEATSYPFNANNCSTAAAAPEQRWPLSVMRYLWDVYDNRNDADGDDYSANVTDFWRHLANTFYYPDGVGANQINEPWSVGLGGQWALTEKDGRGAISSRANYAAVRETNTLRLDNCSPF